jgi:hypothetical protein
MTEQEANDYAVAKKNAEADLQTKAIDSAVKGAKEALEKELNKANEDVKELALKQLETKGSEVIKDDFKVEFEANKEAIKTFLQVKEVKSN